MRRISILGRMAGILRSSIRRSRCSFIGRRFRATEKRTAESAPAISDRRLLIAGLTTRRDNAPYNVFMEFVFTEVPYDPAAFLERDLPQVPKTSGVYKIFDTHGELIVLDKTSHLFRRLERFFGPHSEKLKD